MKKITILCLLSICFWLACTKDTFVFTGVDCNETVTYDGQMQEIIDTNCSYGSCHNGTPGVPGNYTNYDGLSVHFGGELFDRVVNRMQDTIFGMPPNYAEGLTDLTDEDFMLFNCWIDQEFPEN